MSASEHDLQHLVALIEAARAQAGRAGAVAAQVAASLDQAARSTRALLAGGGQPEEGLRPEDLTTENDK